MAFNKKMLPVTLALLLMSSTSYGAWGDYGIELEDEEVCHLAKYSIEASFANIDKSYENFKKNELDKCKSDRERKRFNKRTQELDNIIRRKKEEFQFFLDIGGINRCIEGDAKECERASSTCRNTHAST